MSGYVGQNVMKEPLDIPSQMMPSRPLERAHEVPEYWGRVKVSRHGEVGLGDVDQNATRQLLDTLSQTRPSQPEEWEHEAPQC